MINDTIKRFAQTQFRQIEKIFNITLREPQKIVISANLMGENTLVQLQTGGGKTMLYIAQAFITKQIVLVVTPTIALRNDQVKELTNVEQIQVYQLTAAQGQNQISLQELQNGNLESCVVLVTPEKLQQKTCQNVIKELIYKGKISCITVDECHYMYEWKTFRNAYQDLLNITSEFINTKSQDGINPILMLLTATASPQCQKYLIQEYTKRNINIKKFLFDMYRPNLNFINLNIEAKPEYLLHVLIDEDDEDGDLDHHTLIYCTTKETNKQIQEYLNNRGIKSYLYYSDAQNNEEQVKKFTKNQKSCMCCTVSFGMGINISSVNQVINYNIPQTLNESLQKLGRAGRRGQPSLCIQFYDQKNINYYLKILIANQDFDKIYDFIVTVQAIQRQICMQGQYQQYYDGFNVDFCKNCDCCKSLKAQIEHKTYQGKSRIPQDIEYYLVNIQLLNLKLQDYINEHQVSITKIKQISQTFYNDLVQYIDIFENPEYFIRYIIFELIIRKDIILSKDILTINKKPICLPLNYLLIPLISFSE